MPFYVYKATEKGCKHCAESFEIRQSIKDDALTECPECGVVIQRLITISSHIMRGRSMNNYNDCKAAKYWRDQNGIRHRVTAADGSSSSPTVSRKQTATPEQIKARKQKDKAATTKRLQKIKHGIMRKD